MEEYWLEGEDKESGVTKRCDERQPYLAYQRDFFWEVRERRYVAHYSQNQDREETLDILAYLALTDHNTHILFDNTDSAQVVIYYPPSHESPRGYQELCVVERELGGKGYPRLELI